MSWLNRMATRWWFGHALLLGASAGVMLVAALLTPAPEVVSLFGADLPVLCSWRAMTGYACPGCGLTRSFVFMAHGQVGAAFQMHRLGPLIFLLVASQVPWRTLILLRGEPVSQAPGPAVPQP